LQLFVEAKGLPPAIQLVPRLLRLFLVRAKIKSNVAVRHKSSLRRTALEVKMAPTAKVRMGHCQDGRHWVNTTKREGV
jgi:hypothetical protein